MILPNVCLSKQKLKAAIVTLRLYFLTLCVGLEKISKRLSNSVILETVGQHSDIDSKTAFKQNVVFAVLDSILVELKDRFSDQVTAIMVGIQALTSTA